MKRLLTDDLKGMMFTISIVAIILWFGSDNNELKRSVEKHAQITQDYETRKQEMLERNDNFMHSRLENLRLSLQTLHTETKDRFEKVNAERSEILKECDRYVFDSQLRHDTALDVWHYWSRDRPRNDVTLVTQLTFERLSALSRILSHWGGPVSVAVMVNVTEMSDIEQMLKRFKNESVILRYPDISLHLVANLGCTYPVNLMRNVAFNNTFTDYVFLNDIDFIPSLNQHDELMKRLRTNPMNEHQVWVVPAFDTKNANLQYPEGKSELVSLYDRGDIKPFHWVKKGKYGLRATNYSAWIKSTEPYLVRFEDDFEPYIVGKRTSLPHYNQDFIGRIQDKVSHLMHVSCLGFQFLVLPDTFIIHYPHKKVAYSNHETCGYRIYYNFRKMVCSRKT